MTAVQVERPWELEALLVVPAVGLHIEVIDEDQALREDQAVVVDVVQKET